MLPRKSPVYWFACLTLLTAPLAHGDLAEVLLADWEGYGIDLDEDGVNEFDGLLSTVQNIAFASSFKANPFTVHNWPEVLPGQGTGAVTQQFASIADLKASGLYAGTVSLNALFLGDLHYSTPKVVFNANAAKPVLAGYRFGTKGAGNDPYQVLGFVLDASEFFATGGAAAIKLHTLRFGQIGLGDAPLAVSLAEVLDPGGGNPSSVLEATTTFTTPKAGTISFPSQSGFTYRLRRSVDLGSSTIEDTLEGTGSPLMFSFDDSASGARSAFFWVEAIPTP